MVGDRAVVYVAGHSDRASGSGWAAVIETGGRSYEISGREMGASKQRMELRAVIEAIERCTEDVIEIRCSRKMVEGPDLDDRNLDLWERIATLDDGSVQIIWTTSRPKGDGAIRAATLARRAAAGEVVPYGPVARADALLCQPAAITLAP